MATQQFSSPVLGEDTSVDKLGNTVAAEHHQEDRESTKREIRDAERKARLGSAVTPPDRRRGTDRGIDIPGTGGQPGQGKDYDQRQTEQLEQLEQKSNRRQFDRHGGYGYSMKDKKYKQGWGDPLTAELDTELEMDPNDPAADQPSP